MGYGIPVWSGCIVKSTIIPTGVPVTWILLRDHVQQRRPTDQLLEDDRMMPLVIYACDQTPGGLSLLSFSRERRQGCALTGGPVVVI